MAERSVEVPTFQEKVLENPRAVLNAVSYLESGLVLPERAEAAKQFVEWLNGQWKEVDRIISNRPVEYGHQATVPYRFARVDSRTVIQEKVDLANHRFDVSRIEIVRDAYDGRGSQESLSFKVSRDDRNTLIDVEYNERKRTSETRREDTDLGIGFHSEGFDVKKTTIEHTTNSFDLNSPAAV